MNSEKQIFVVAGVIEHDGRILVAQRRSRDLIAPDQWEFPGGKLNFGESPEFALQRELQEELGIGIQILTLLRIDSHTYQASNRRLHVILASYRCKIVSGEPKAREVQDFKWLRPEELLSLSFAAADLGIVHELSSAAKRLSL